MIAEAQIGGYPVGLLLILPMALFFGSFPYLVKLNALRDQFVRKIYLTQPWLWRQLGRPRGRMWSPRHEPVKMEEPDECPPDGTVQFGWYDTNEPFWLKEYPDLVPDYRELRKRHRFWAFVLMPIILGVSGLIVLINAILS